MAKRKRQRQAAEAALQAGEQRRRRRLTLAAVIALPVALVVFGLGGWNYWQTTSEFATLVEAGQPALERVQREASRGREHVPRGTPVSSERDFPLSGPHWDSWVDPGLYDTRQPRGELVHSLEHGLVVIYYDRLSDEAESRLRAWTRRFDGPWSGIVAVPHPGLGEGVVLTAWRHRLELDEFEPAAMAAFIDAYRGRGPENPVR